MGELTGAVAIPRVACDWCNWVLHSRIAIVHHKGARCEDYIERISISSFSWKNNMDGCSNDNDALVLTLRTCFSAMVKERTLVTAFGKIQSGRTVERKIKYFGWRCE